MTDYWTENGLEKPTEWVVCAANRHPSGLIICGARHRDPIMRAQAEASGLDDWRQCEQGFINQFGEFLTREEAMIKVKLSGQPFDAERCGGNGKMLFSEGLY